MKKIMFNDRFGLTRAVLEGRKTMTRRVIPIEKIDKYGHCKCDNRSHELIRHCAAYRCGEEVAVAQRYKDLSASPAGENIVFESKGCASGWGNKMFVKAEYMPYCIRIINIKVERLRDISDEDCIKEGVGVDDNWIVPGDIYTLEIMGKRRRRLHYPTPRMAFADLFDCVSRKDLWRLNPWVFVYEFTLMKKL